MKSNRFTTIRNHPLFGNKFSTAFNYTTQLSWIENPEPANSITNRTQDKKSSEIPKQTNQSLLKYLVRQNI